MSNTYSFREANLDDLPLVHQWTEALMEHEVLDPVVELSLNDNISELVKDWLENLISDNNSLIIIAEDESKSPVVPLGLVIGFLQLQPNNFTKFEMHGVIQMVWVDKKQRNKGLATLLVSHMEDTFKNLKVPYCEIQYSHQNEEAKGFWQKAGYQHISHSCRKIF